MYYMSNAATTTATITVTREQAEKHYAASRETIAQANSVAYDLAAFNETNVPLRITSRVLRDVFAKGDKVRALPSMRAPRGKAGTEAEIVAWEGSHFGYSIAHLRYEGTKRTYPVSIFALHH